MKHTAIFVDIKPVSKLDCLSIEIPFFSALISAGFPSPALDFTSAKIDLNASLIEHPSATYCMGIDGDSMLNAGILDGNLVIIDRSLTVCDGVIAVCSLNGDFLVKRIKIENGEWWLMPENEKYHPIKVEKESDFKVFGVVTFTIKSFLKCTPW